MFGYIRPAKEELKLKDFTKYRSIYCGLCKEIKKTYGNIPRLALTYDMTFFAIIGISLSENDGTLNMESCFLNPLKKKPILTEHKFLELAAALSVLLAQIKITDDYNDSEIAGRKVKQSIKSIAFKPYYKRAVKNYKIYNDIILENIKKLTILEKQFSNNDNVSDKNPIFSESSDIFGNLLAGVFKKAFKEIFKSEKNEIILNEAMEKFGFYLGKWIYILDAVDDYERDVCSKEFNPFLPLEMAEVKIRGEEILVMCEDRMDKIAALLPYKRFGSIISNIIIQGMPEVRKKIFDGGKLGKL